MRNWRASLNQAFEAAGMAFIIALALVVAVAAGAAQLVIGGAVLIGCAAYALVKRAIEKPALPITIIAAVIIWQLARNAAP